MWLSSPLTSIRFPHQHIAAKLTNVCFWYSVLTATLVTQVIPSFVFFSADQPVLWSHLFCILLSRPMQLWCSYCWPLCSQWSLWCSTMQQQQKTVNNWAKWQSKIVAAVDRVTSSSSSESRRGWCTSKQHRTQHTVYRHRRRKFKLTPIRWRHFNRPPGYHWHHAAQSQHHQATERNRLAH